MHALSLVGVLAFANIVDAPAAAESAETAEPRPRTAWIVSANPVAPIAGRWGANAELVLAGRHGLRVSGSWVDIKTWTAENGTGLVDARGVDTEVGYRLYHRDATGLLFFLGPAASLGSFRGAESRIYAETARAPGADHVNPVHDFVQVAIAADVGVRYTTSIGLTMALGLGAKLAFVDKRFDDPRDVRIANVSQRGLGPRLLAEVGWSF